jgi:hypothetical protein
MPNQFGDIELTLWFHPACAAYKRPESLLQALAEAPGKAPHAERLEAMARSSLAQRRLQRIDGAERARSGQATCRHCRQPIERGSWRIRLVFFEEGRFAPAGFVHLGCRSDYFGADDILDQVLHFSPDLSDDDREELKRLASGHDTQQG